MAENLVVVESPAKAKTIKKYLGKGYEVLACYGHVRDLIPKTGAVDTENDFAMKYELIEKNEKHVNKIIAALKKADHLFLAPDPDREGEAIAWHLAELLKEKNKLEGKTVHRVSFNQITKKAVQEAVANPREIEMELVDAQQARRALDYLVGFTLSPILWKKIQPGLSAGRVQTPALRLIVEREFEIEAFETKEYWSIHAKAEAEKQDFMAKLVEYDSKKVEQFTVTDEKTSNEMTAALIKAADGYLLVKKVTKKDRKRNPTAPFITSTLQQEAARKLGFSASKTMQTAQKLYEGIDLGDGATGLITYMRTDSVNMAQEAIDELREMIEGRYGKDHLPDKSPEYKTKAKNAQEAHEAIRPTSANRIPEDVKDKLNEDQYKLYNLIWKRTVASQMIPATLHTVAIELEASKGNTFRANGSVIAIPGFMTVYHEDVDDKKTDDSLGKVLPAMNEGDKIKTEEIFGEQHFTEPPPRFSEASLVKALEEFGIGRPSTYASIINTLRYRNYVEMDNKRFFPTDTARIVIRFLTKFFAKYVDYDFTANLEDDLDKVSRGEETRLKLLTEFWKPFIKLVEENTEKVSREEVIQARTLGTDPESGKPVSVRMGRYGPYAQIGTKEDEDKPKFASLRQGQRLETITFEESMYLFVLPRALGETPDGEPVTAAVGRFGPYVKYGAKFASIKSKEMDEDPYTIELPRALEIIAAKKQADIEKFINEFEDEGIKVLNGRYGPYVTNGKVNVKIPKDTDPKSLTLEDCQKLIKEAPAKKFKRGGKKK